MMKAIQKSLKDTNTKTKNDKDKNTDKIKTPDICYMFEILMTHPFQI